jgi:hypothetical protein
MREDELFAGEDLEGPAGQGEQNPVLGWSEEDGGVVQKNALFGDADGETAFEEERLSGFQGVHPAKDGADPGDQFPGAEGLDEIVVRSDVGPFSLSPRGLRRGMMIGTRGGGGGCRQISSPLTSGTSGRGSTKSYVQRVEEGQRPFSSIASKTRCPSVQVGPHTAQGFGRLHYEAVHLSLLSRAIFVNDMGSGSFQSIFAERPAPGDTSPFGRSVAGVLRRCAEEDSAAGAGAACEPWAAPWLWALFPDTEAALWSWVPRPAPDAAPGSSVFIGHALPEAFISHFPPALSPLIMGQAFF